MKKWNDSHVFFILYIAYLLNQVFSESKFNDIAQIRMILGASRYMIIVGLAILIIAKKKMGTVCKFTTLIALLVLTVTNMLLFDGGISLLVIIMFIWAAQGYSEGKIVAASFWTLLLSHGLIMVCAHFGIVIEDSVNVRYIGNYAGDFFSGQYVRHDMGFTVHNQVPLIFFCLYTILVVYKKNTIKWYENLLVLILNYVIFVFFGSRVVFLMMIVAVALYCVIVVLEKTPYNKYVLQISKLGIVGYPLFLIASFLFAVKYDKNDSLSQTLDLFLNNRVRLANEAIDFYGITLLGAGKDAGTYNSIVFPDNTVDNGYVLLFIQRGLLIGIMIVGIWCYLSWLGQKKKNVYLVLALMILAVGNIINAHLLSYKMLPFLCMLLNSEDKFLEEDVERVKFRITFD